MKSVYTERLDPYASCEVGNRPLPFLPCLSWAYKSQSPNPSEKWHDLETTLVCRHRGSYS